MTLGFLVGLMVCAGTVLEEDCNQKASASAFNQAASAFSTNLVDLSGGAVTTFSFPLTILDNSGIVLLR